MPVHGTVARVPHSPATGAWRRRRQIVHRRRAWDRFTGWVLATLVLISLSLGVALWSGALWSQRPLASGASRYVADSADVGLGVAQSLTPEWMILLYPGNGTSVAMGDPDGTAVVWGAVRALLTALRPAQFAVGTHAGSKTVAHAAAALPRGSVGVDVNLGATFQWSTWDRALGGPKAWSGPDPQFDRIVILPGSTAPACSPAGGTPSGEPVVDLLTVAGAGFQVQVNQGDYCTLLSVLDSQQLRAAGYPVAPVVAPASALPVAPGVLAPSAFPWTPVALRPEGLDPSRLAASIFPDPLSVVPRSADGAFEFQNSADWSLTVTKSQAELVVPAPRTGAAAPEWDVGLAEALRYVDARGGGWPSTAWLAWWRAECTLTKCAPGAFEYQFATRYAGLPVLAPTGTLAAITVQIVGGNGQPVLYTRDVPVPGASLSQPAMSAMSAADAVAAVALTPSAGQLGAATQVVAVFPAWAAETKVLTPAWAVEVDQGSAGTLETFLVDAYQGAVLGSWPPN